MNQVHVLFGSIALVCVVTVGEVMFLPMAGALVVGYAEGAPPGFSGGFGEDSCRACHFDADANVAPGRVSIANVPARFTAGERYELTITLTRPGVKVAGFQMTARFKDKGAQAGTLTAGAGEEKRTHVDVDSNIQYIGQRREGAAPVAADTARWLVTWTAPQTSAPVVFHVAANAADADESARGDYIYTAMIESAAAPPPMLLRAAHR